MADECKKRGVRFLDAPVAGSKIPAEQAQLIFFVGGDKGDLEFSMPLLEAMGKAVFHIGGNGMGTAMKMVNNLLLAGAMAAFSEAMVLGEALGIPREALFDTPSQIAGDRPLSCSQEAPDRVRDFRDPVPAQMDA